MLGKPKDQEQRDLFAPLLADFIDQRHPLALLAKRIDWKHFEKQFAEFYSKQGRQSMALRLMVGSLLLKRLYNLGDETLAKAWVMNPYMQYFCGEARFQHKYPCDPSDLVHFRDRIGEAGAAKIMAYSITIHGKDALGRMNLSDTTVQENNITFPTDAKLAKKVIDRCNAIAAKEHIAQRQSYTRTAKGLVRQTHNGKHPKRAKAARRAGKRLRTLAGRQLRELERRLSPAALKKYDQEMQVMERAATQQRHDKNKVYSIHKPHTACIAKGKSHKQYEFGHKVGLITTSKNLLITAIKAFDGNPHDSKTIEPLLEQMQRNLGHLPEELIYDRGGRGNKDVLGVTISTPSKPKATDSRYQRQKARMKFRRRAAIEPVIGHLKTDHHMGQNYLLGPDSAQINAYLAAAGWNFKKLMEKLRQGFSFPLFSIRNFFSIRFRMDPAL